VIGCYEKVRIYLSLRAGCDDSLGISGTCTCAATNAKFEMQVISVQAITIPDFRYRLTFCDSLTDRRRPAIRPVNVCVHRRVRPSRCVVGNEYDVAPSTYVGLHTTNSSISSRIYRPIGIVTAGTKVPVTA